MASQEEIFDPRRNGAAQRNLPPPFELPSEKVKVEIKLVNRINNVLQSLPKDLEPHYMDSVSLHLPKNSVITISGYPAVNGFDEHTILTIVQRYDPQASLLPPRL